MPSMSLASGVADMWSKSDTLLARAAKGYMVLTPNEHIGREDLITNEDVMVPVLKHLGMRTTVDIIHEHVELFMHWARPRGKLNIKRPLA